LGYKNTERYFSSGGNIEEIGHESSLPANVAFPDSFNLSLPDHVHGLIPADGPPRRVEGAEHEVNGLARGIHRAVEVRPFFFDFDVGFSDAVGAIGRPQMRAASFSMNFVNIEVLFMPFVLADNDLRLEKWRKLCDYAQFVIM
jgi:hypothetical protein